MKKEKSSGLWWLVSPTYKYAEKKKFELIAKSCTPGDLSKALRSYNRRYLCTSIAICVTAALLVPLGYFLFEGGFYAHSLIKYIFGGAVALISWGFLVSRAVEIFKAFLDDAVQKLDRDEPSSDLKFGQRLRLSFNSYIELIINFATLYYLVPSSFYKDSYELSTIFEALYFSGVTITTLGYGDISPSNPILQLLSVFQVLSGFALIVVCFAIYSGLALGQEKSNNRVN
ncbi:potassium channel family protein [Shewanella algae]|uniref:potassium channel family protein n=1 Tax=Shewanella algae TaxID=38313 RepID=UPI000C32040E|nr:potassium channel family protein [Shewanella algae]MBO2642439.1 two pore domain potassium channel family protein [Shewanella algae]